MGRLGNSRVTRFMILTNTGGSVGSGVTRLVSGRVRQGIHLVGYHLWGVQAIRPTADNQDFQAISILQVDETDHAVQPLSWFPEAFVPVPERSTIIDAIFQDKENVEDSAVGNRLIPETLDMGWANCDLVLPGLFLFGSIRGTVSAAYRTGVTIEYEMIDLSANDIAAINFHWSQDPQDFDR